jgi:hypothetical protein
MCGATNDITGDGTEVEIFATVAMNDHPDRYATRVCDCICHVSALSLVHVRVTAID